MEPYISKSALVVNIERRRNQEVQWMEKQGYTEYHQGLRDGYVNILSLINTLEVKEIDFIVNPYDACIQYTDRESAIKAHAEDYSWNIESELFQQLTPEQQKLWRKEIEQACISGGHCGIELAKDRRYDNTLEVKEVELTWEDIPEIFRISEQLKTSWWFRDNEQTKQIGTQVFWEEVLKRFKAMKEELV